MSLESIELLGLAFAMVVQYGVVMWWAATMNNRITTAEKWIEANDRVSERLATMETKIDSFLELCKDMRDTFRIIFERLEKKADKP